MKNTFKEGDLVRVKADAFGDSTDKVDVEARGQIGTLIECMDNSEEEDPCWIWRGLNGKQTIPLSSELEAIQPAEITLQMVLDEAVTWVHSNIRYSDTVGLATLQRLIDAAAAQRSKVKGE